MQKFHDLGAQRLEGTPFTMKVWRLENADGSVFQYFVTTIVDDDVVSLSAILTNPKLQEPVFRALLGAYSGNFQALAPCSPAR